MMYEPNDSPFGDAYRLWRYNGRPESWSSGDTDELLSTAKYLLSIPVNADDGDLGRFRDALALSHDTFRAR